jgi:hypothetical protein
VAQHHDRRPGQRFQHADVEPAGRQAEQAEQARRAKGRPQPEGRPSLPDTGSADPLHRVSIVLGGTSRPVPALPEAVIVARGTSRSWVAVGYRSE